MMAARRAAYGFLSTRFGRADGIWQALRGYRTLTVGSVLGFVTLWVGLIGWGQVGETGFAHRLYLTLLAFGGDPIYAVGLREINAPISADAFDFWLDMLLAFNGPDIMRMKGIVHVDDMPWPFVFHGVQHIFDAPVPLKSWTDPDKKTRVVVIARNMYNEELKENLNMLLFQSKEVVVSANDLIPETAEMPF